MSCENTLNDFYRGDTVPILVTIKDADGDPIDITGSRIRMTLKENKDDLDPGALQKDAVLTDPTNGQALITLSSSDTDIEAREYYYDIEWKDVSDNIRTLMNATISVFQDITTTEIYHDMANDIQVTIEEVQVSANIVEQDLQVELQDQEVASQIVEQNVQAEVVEEEIQVIIEGAVVSGGLTEVVSDDTLEGTGTASSPLYVAEYVQGALILRGLACSVAEAVGDWCKVTGSNTVEKIEDNASPNILGVIMGKPTTTTCDVIVAGLAEVFTGLDASKVRYFLSDSGGETDVPPGSDYVIELGKPLNETTMIVNLVNTMRRAT